MRRLAQDGEDLAVNHKPEDLQELERIGAVPPAKRKLKNVSDVSEDAWMIAKLTLNNHAISIFVATISVSRDSSAK